MIEEQTLNFVIQIVDKGSTAAVKGINSAMDKVRSVMQAVADKAKAASGGLSGFAWAIARVATNLTGWGILGGLGLLKLAIAGVWIAIDRTILSFLRLYTDLSEFRRQTGMTTDELHEFTTSVIDASRRYGVALSSVGDIARVVALGTNKSAASVVDFAAKIALLGRVTGQSDRTVAEFAFSATRGLLMAEEAALKLGIGIQAVAKGYRLRAEDVTSIFNTLQGSILSLGTTEREYVTHQLPAFIAEFLRAGAAVSDTTGFIQQMLDKTSRIGQLFVSSGYDVNLFLSRLNAATRGARSDTVAWQAMAQTMELNASSLEYAQRAGSGFLNTLKDLWDAANDPEALANLYKQRDAFQNLESIVNRISSSLTKLGGNILTPETVKNVESFLDMVDKRLEELVGKGAGIQDIVDAIKKAWGDKGGILEFLETTVVPAIGRILALLAKEFALEIAKALWEALVPFGIPGNVSGGWNSTRKDPSSPFYTSPLDELRRGEKAKIEPAREDHPFRKFFQPSIPAPDKDRTPIGPTSFNIMENIRAAPVSGPGGNPSSDPVMVAARYIVAGVVGGIKEQTDVLQREDVDLMGLAPSPLRPERSVGLGLLGLV